MTRFGLSTRPDAKYPMGNRANWSVAALTPSAAIMTIPMRTRAASQPMDSIAWAMWCEKVGRYVYTEGRKKDVINRGGEKISSVEVEDLILAHPKVENVCIVAMPDAVYGERACA